MLLDDRMNPLENVNYLFLRVQNSSPQHLALLYYVYIKP